MRQLPETRTPPLPAPVALQRMQPVARQFHVLGRFAPPPVPSRYDGYGGSGVAAPVGQRPVRLVVAVLHVRAPNAAQYVAEARFVASLATSIRLPGGTLRSSGRFVAFTLKSLR